MLGVLCSLAVVSVVRVTPWRPASQILGLWLRRQSFASCMHRIIMSSNLKLPGNSVGCRLQQPADCMSTLGVLLQSLPGSTLAESSLSLRL